jgi:nucleoid-associated protein YgaU
MPKDLKTGLVIGLVVVVAAALWLSTRESLSIKSRMLKGESQAEPRYVTELPVSNSTGYDERTTEGEGDKTGRPAVPRIHVVVKGETLSEISYKYYGTSAGWQKIFEANRTFMKDEKNLRPGTRLIIPE